MPSLADELKRDVERLALPNGRKVGTDGHEQARLFLLGRLQELRLAPYRGGSFDLPYRVDGQDFHNLIGVLPGSDRNLRPVLIGAHYDSVIEGCCADDNAAAVAIALSAADTLANERLRRDVVIAIFDAEEPLHWLEPSMGSTRFYEDQRLPIGFHSALIMDLVGHDVSLGNLPLRGDRIANLLFVMGAESHPMMKATLEEAVSKTTLPVVATLNRYLGADMSDHHAFRLNYVPYLFLSCGWWAHYHEMSDTPDQLNYVKMGRIRDFLIELLRGLVDDDGGSAVERVPGPEGPDDPTVKMEIELFKRAVGPLLGMILRELGIRSLETREDIDRLANWIAATFRQETSFGP